MCKQDFQFQPSLIPLRRSERSTKTDMRVAVIRPLTMRSAKNVLTMSRKLLLRYCHILLRFSGVLTITAGLLRQQQLSYRLYERI
jgi:hypothetical protein